MTKIILKKKAKIYTDFFLILGIISLAVYHDTGAKFATTWHSIHCVISIIWLLIMIIHVWQHWKFIKALSKIKFALQNKITVIVTFCFVLMFVSILLLIFGIENYASKYHNIIGHIFVGTIIVHVIEKLKKFILMNKKYLQQIKWKNILTK